MGEVFKARHVHLNAFRCMKVIKQTLISDDVYRMRFFREARLATQIHHPNGAALKRSRSCREPVCTTSAPVTRKGRRCGAAGIEHSASSSSWAA
jgi:serine/threonine protein kinase